MKDIFKKLIKFRDQRDWKQFHTPANLAKSISIEAAELLECFQWNDEYESDNVQQELADIIIYCLLMTEALGVDFEDIVNEKIEINTKKYPVEKARGNSKKANKL